jgi:hypothetical protein
VPKCEELNKWTHAKERLVKMHKTKHTVVVSSLLGSVNRLG